MSQPGFERVIELKLEHLDELGDVCRKRLIIELMGKHSNIIFCKEDGTILDSIKHISAQVSSVREVLPGREYFIPRTANKANPLTVTEEEFGAAIRQSPMPLSKALYQTLTGISPIIGEEICHLASIDGDISANALSDMELLHLYRTFQGMMADVREGNFSPNIVYEGDFQDVQDDRLNGPKGGGEEEGTDWEECAPVEFAALPLTCFMGANYRPRHFSSISRLLETYYASKNTITRIRQKSSDLRRIVQTALERNYKKYDLQSKQLKDTEKREKYRVYGELINTYGYGVEPGSRSFVALNYYTGENITIPLDPQIPVQENDEKYFDKYGKLKRTCEAVTALLKETGAEIEHLRSVQTALDIALQEEDLVQIKEELMESGYIRKRNPGNRRPKITSRPFHYVSSDGFHIYVGKNNLQNDELTFKFASGNDWWFHAKGTAGSHVILKSEGKEVPNRAFEEAGRLAAYYSKSRGNEKVEIDYVEKKHVKKPGSAKPGFVVYYTNYSLMIDSDISGLTLLT